MKKLLIAIIVFILLIFILVQFLPSTKVTFHNLTSSRDSFMCEEDKEGVTQKNEFDVKDEISVCFYITSIQEEETYRITVRVYKVGKKNELQDVLDMYEEVPHGDNRIQLQLDFDPGQYLVEVYSIRTFLFRLSFTVL
jgi:hypothetical protein